MFESLGPNMAKSLMGDAYNPEYRYELETDDSGFHIIVTNTRTNDKSFVHLETEAPNPEKYRPLLDEDAHRKLKRGVTGFNIWFWLLMLGAVSIIAVVLWRAFL